MAHARLPVVQAVADRIRGRMTKAAVVILAENESHADYGRLANALEAAKEFAENDDELEVIFDGAGVQWIPELEAESSDYHDLYAAVREHVSV